MTDEGPQRQIVKARWVFPVTGAPLENGVVEIEAGKIVALHNRNEPRADDLGNVALIPGLINAHTHLELSDIAAPLSPPLPFTRWLQSVIGHRRSRTETSIEATETGTAESARQGTTLLADIVNGDWSLPLLSSPGPRTLALFEVLGLGAHRIANQLAAAEHFLAEPIAAPGFVQRGLSPHAPYSVHPRLFEGLVDLAVTHDVPLATHLAETLSELELLATGRGEFVEFLSTLGVWDPDAIPFATRPLDYLRPLARVRHALVIHGNYLARDEIEYLAENPGISVVYCPRTHHYFQHSPHPWRELLQKGVNVAVGTDSRASNPDLGVWKELQFLRRQFVEVSPETLLRLGTIDAARAVGWEARVGSLEPGKEADLAVVSLENSPADDPGALLFSSKNSIVATMCAGNWLSRPTRSRG